MSNKDLFSTQSKAYAAFRPTYPKALYDYIFKRVQNFHTAWDCATGNGQVARDLCKHFESVYGTDISQKQLDEAYQAANIHYSISPAEKTNFADQTFDLITVGQALHWIDLEMFYKEVKRVAKKDAVLAVWGYSFLTISPEIDHYFKDFYFNTVGDYWDAARKLIESEYDSIPFPFSEREEAKFYIEQSWSREQFAGYLTSWSATQKFIQARQHSPVPEFISTIKSLWPEEEMKQVRFPVFIKIGRV